MTDDQRIKEALEHLKPQPQFKYFCLRVIQMAGIFSRTTDGSDGRNLSYDEGRRNLGLDILEMLEAHEPQAPLLDIPAATLTQIFLGESQQPTEKPSGRRNQYDRHSELAGADDD